MSEWADKKTDELLDFALGLSELALDIVDVYQKGDRSMMTSLVTKRGACIDINFELSYTEPPGIDLPDVWLTLRAPNAAGLMTSCVLDLVTAEAFASAIILACRKAAKEHIIKWGVPSGDEETAQTTLNRLAADAPQETEAEEKSSDPTQQ